MEKAYLPEVHDLKWQKFWEEQQIGNPEISYALHAKPSKEKFVMVMPPPNVTGVLHQGHALMLALEDTLTRWERMCGKETLYLPGTDHASIAVNMQVVKHLEKQGINYKKLGREKFVEEAWKWIREYQPRIYKQIKALGVSCDWSRVKFTLDLDLNKAVNHAFVTLYQRGFIYRAQRLVNWCPKTLSVISDLEVISEERDVKLWHIKYPVDGGGYVVVATTRPETLLGDVAVAVHPDDTRYKSVVGKKVTLPFTDRKIPIIADSFVEQSFGSGAVKITPAHDFADYDVGQRHKLPLINIFTPEAKIVSGLPSEAAGFAGLDRFDARKKMIALLTERGLLEKEEPYKTRIGYSERAHVPVEPYLSHQWFCKMDSMAANVVTDLKKEKFRFVPHEFHNQFMRWMESIRDWCISRQLWWGHPIPAYHCVKCSKIEVSETPVTTCSKCGGTTNPDPDVLDTWFSSALWPFSTMGWPEKTTDFKKFYPTQVMETGFDILFFWVARMLLVGKELTGELPFTDVYLHPMVRDEHGDKMSKSKGNTIDPIEIVSELGADALRMTLNGLCVQGRDLRLSMERIEGYRNFINKVWNATKFVLMDESVKEIPVEKSLPKNLVSEWILSRMNNCSKQLNESWKDFRMQEATEIFYHFVWNDFCDWFVEISKTDRKFYQPTLAYVLDRILKMFHPFCPHVSEELWHELPGIKASDSLAVQMFPLGEKTVESDSMKFLKEVVTSVRTMRNENRIPLSNIITMYVEANPLQKKLLEENRAWVELLAKMKLDLVTKAPKDSQVIPVSNVSFKYVPVAFAGVEEIERTKKEIKNLDQYTKGLRAKLSNDSFVSKAPPNVVQSEKSKLQEAEEKLKKLEANLTRLESL